MTQDIIPRNDKGWPRTKKQYDLCWLHVFESLAIYAAAMKAGYTKHFAKKKSSALAKVLKPFIEHLQKEKNKQLEVRHEITVDRIANELAAIGFANPKEYVVAVQVNGVERVIGKPLTELTDQQAKAVVKWEIVEFANGEETVLDYRYTFADKRGAIVDMGKHLGMFNDRLILEARVQSYKKVDLSGVPDAILEKWMGELERYQNSVIEGEAEVVS